MFPTNFVWRDCRKNDYVEKRLNGSPRVQWHVIKTVSLWLVYLWFILVHFLFVLQNTFDTSPLFSSLSSLQNGFRKTNSVQIEESLSLTKFWCIHRQRSTGTFLIGLPDREIMLENPLERQKRLDMRQTSMYRPVPGDPVVFQTLFSHRERFRRFLLIRTDRET